MAVQKKPQKEGSSWVGKVEEYSRKIWLAGLGVYSKIDSDGSKLFETLVKDGEKAEKVANSAVGKKVTAAKATAGSRISDAKKQVLGTWGELEGALDKRLNSFNDFVDVARGLVAAGWAGEGRISASGGSAGGELMGAVVNSNPELWQAVVADVPFVDVLNTMLDESLPLTPGEWPEWGNPIADKAAFELIRSYSPYDNVKVQAYPPMLVTAGLNDPRVTYWEPAKWVAKLRATKTDDNVLLLRTNMDAGHGGKSGRFAALDETAEEFAFILAAFDAAGH